MELSISARFVAAALAIVRCADSGSGRPTRCFVGEDMNPATAIRPTPRLRATVFAGAVAFALPAFANEWATEGNVALNGTNLTYYRQPDQAQCLSACASNGNCRGATWIQAGTFNPRDPAMCYLLSTVTGRVAARGHYSMVKSANTPAQGGDAAFRPPQINGVVVDNCAVWGNDCGWGGAHQFCRSQGYGAARSFQLSRPGRTYVIGSRRLCEGANCVGFSEVICMSAGATAPPVTTQPPAPTPPAAKVSGQWQWNAKCPEGNFGGLFGIGPLAADGSFQGGFENAGGSIKGRAQGNTIDFIKTSGDWQERWSATLAPGAMNQGVIDRSTRRLGNCSWSGHPYS